MSEKNQEEASSPPFDYEGSIGRLEEIVALLDNQDTRLEDALKLYEEGVDLARSCMQRLRDAELRLTELKLTDSDTDG